MSDAAESMTLRSCPFCGGPARRSRRQDESLWSHAQVWWSCARCDECDVQLVECDDPDYSKVTASWNRRAVPAGETPPASAETWYWCNNPLCRERQSWHERAPICWRCETGTLIAESRILGGGPPPETTREEQ